MLADFTIHHIGDKGGTAHLALAPPAAFLPSPGEPSISFTLMDAHIRELLAGSK